MMGEPGPSELEMRTGIGIITLCVIGLLTGSTVLMIMYLLGIAYLFVNLRRYQ